MISIVYVVLGSKYQTIYYLSCYDKALLTIGKESCGESTRIPAAWAIYPLINPENIKLARMHSSLSISASTLTLSNKHKICSVPSKMHCR